ncbi:MAG TPA: M14 family metallopeptidase [Gemmatimonadota bacterium]|nr:M14 family metallopeptidase [Gemmatimonadota bacterium]
MSRSRKFLLLVLVLALPGSALGQTGGARFDRMTRPELTDYEETSRYADVMAFVEEAVAQAPWMHLTMMGYSMEGRALPLVVVGEVADASPEAVLASGKLRMYVGANIHAGEVCGKEAMLALLRELADGEHAEWRESLVLLIAPIYNADGNERIGLTNRRGQHGPVAGMGQRANAQGLDLNRDNMKLESPEARSMVATWKRYDPHIVMDLHTTNGTRHAYYATYAPPLHPNTDAGIIELSRGRLLPEVTRALKAKYGWDYYYYGNLPWRGMDVERGWYTFGHEPRYLTNYVGVRNRIGILSEAYSYATFEDRILASKRLVEEVANYAHGHAGEIARIIQQADEEPVVGQRQALRATFQRAPQPVEILMGDVEVERNPYSGEPMLRRLDVVNPETMPEFGTFTGTELETVPAAYLVPAEFQRVLNLLDDHGVKWTTLAADEMMKVERFAIDSMQVAEREYQGHKQRTLFGTYEEVELTIAAGTAVVSLEQPLGRLAFLLLEPRSDDGLVNWNFFDQALEEGPGSYPVYRVRR